MKRAVIHIDEEKCNGCGECVPSCAEGALQIIDGKARLVADNLCDGLGACLGDCPMGALVVEEREADEFDEAAVQQFLAAQKEAESPAKAPAGGCPGSMARALHTTSKETAPLAQEGETPSELTQWPVQLKLVNPGAPHFKNADLLIAADCVPFAYADFHRQFLRGRVLTIGCPKLDDAMSYVEKLTELIRINDVNSITIVYMEVPCCGGLAGIVREAIKRSGRTVPVEHVQISLEGTINYRQTTG
ncbi:MAG: 4Fe-4S binding protein [Firmicutes bacterium]|nr:4Fe-4S binding protein [Bacillota bacterium]